MGNPSNPSAVYRAVRALVIVTLVSQVCQLAISPVEASRKTSANTLPKETRAAGAGLVHNNKANVGDEFVVPPKVAVSTVAWLTLAMAVATGLGAVPFFFVQVEPRWGGICNGVASGVMLAASFDLIQEGQKYGGGSWVVVGILSGGLFILLSQQFVHHHFGEVSMLDVKGADVPKMILVVSIMTLHSFGEGSGVGVSFAGPKGLSQGVMVTIAIAVHNIPEGLAVSLLLSNQGLSAKQSMLWSIFTSLPQPLVAVPAFLCAEAFHKFLPFCMGFAGGCMIWMVMAEVMPDSFKDAGKSEVATAATLAVTFMEALSALLDNNNMGDNTENASMLVAYLSLGIGPLAGATIHMLLLNSVNKLPVNMATGIGEGVALVVATWKPLQMLLDGKKLNVFQLAFLFFTGACLHFLLRKYVESKSKGSKATTESILSGGANVMMMTPIARRACLAALMLWLYTFVEGVAMGVAMSPGIPHLVFPVALHGLPRGVGVGSIVYGATGSKKGSSFAAVLTSLAGPMGAVCAALCGVVGSSGGFECWIVLACGGVFPWSRVIDLLRGRRGACKGDPKPTHMGISMGVVLTIMCLTTTRLVCLHTPYCGTSS